VTIQIIAFRSTICVAVYYTVEVVLMLESEDEVLKCDHPNESY